MSADETVELTVGIVTAYVSNNHLPMAELAALIGAVHARLAGLGRQEEAQAEARELVQPTPAQIRRSITPEALISFEDGRPYKTLRRHLSTRGLTAEAYRTKWGLPADYPMVAAAYSAHRSSLAHALGLGHSRRAADPDPDSPEPAAPAQRGRRKPQAA